MLSNFSVKVTPNSFIESDLVYFWDILKTLLHKRTVRKDKINDQLIFLFSYHVWCVFSIEETSQKGCIESTTNVLSLTSNAKETESAIFN